MEGTWIYQGAISYTGAAYQWFRDKFCQDLMEEAAGSKKNSFTLMNEEAEKAALYGTPMQEVYFLEYL